MDDSSFSNNQEKFIFQFIGQFDETKLKAPAPSCHFVVFASQHYFPEFLHFLIGVFIGGTSTKTVQFFVVVIFNFLADSSKQTVFLRAAMNTYVENYRFKTPMTLINDENGNLLPQGIEGNVKKSRISAGYFGLCAGLGFKISRLMLMFDFNADLLSKSVAMYKNPKKTLYDISGFNNIRYRVGASATVNGFGIYVDYCLTPLFRKGIGNDGNVTSIGIRWGF